MKFMMITFYKNLIFALTTIVASLVSLIILITLVLNNHWKIGLVLSLLSISGYLAFMIPTFYKTPYTLRLYIQRIYYESFQYLYQCMTFSKVIKNFGLSYNLTKLENVSPAYGKLAAIILKQNLNGLRKYENHVTKCLEEKRPGSFQQWISYNNTYWILSIYSQMYEVGYLTIPPLFYYHPTLFPSNPYYGVIESLKFTLLYNQNLKNYTQFKDFIIRINAVPEYVENVLRRFKKCFSDSIFPPKRMMDTSLKTMEEMFKYKDHEITAHPIYLKFLWNLDKCKNQAFYPKHHVELMDQLKEKLLAMVKSFKKVYNYYKSVSVLSRNEIGIWNIPNGPEKYRRMINYYTSTSMHPIEIIERGNKEIEYIRNMIIELAAPDFVYDPSIESFGAFVIRIIDDPRFKFQGKDKTQSAIDYIKRIWDDYKERMSDTFDVKISYNIHVLKKDMKSNIPSIYFSSYDTEENAELWINSNHHFHTSVVMTKVLAFREGIPGFHLQTEFSNKNEELDIFRRNTKNYSLFVSWGAYAASLGIDFGWYETKWELLGYYIMDLRTTVAMVVDGSVHYEGVKLSRELAIDLLTDNGYKKEEGSEMVDQISVLPGMSVAPKLGQIKLKELRSYCKQQLGDQFDIKKYHSVILKSGMVPIGVLYQVVQYWVSEKLNNPGGAQL